MFNNSQCKQEPEEKTEAIHPGRLHAEGTRGGGSAALAEHTRKNEMDHDDSAGFTRK
jgi:hypothetical protein